LTTNALALVHAAPAETTKTPEAPKTTYTSQASKATKSSESSKSSDTTGAAEIAAGVTRLTHHARGGSGRTGSCLSDALAAGLKPLKIATKAVAQLKVG
jgi:hypothetical protein